ncbi:MAG: F0F1 ATP synthase subunit epsilon [Bacteroidales bacterium]|nr:F0F1 ATP synthase subunit epsilon [Bacteroidales bacterium]
MADFPIFLEVISPEGALASVNVASVELPGTAGRFVVLKDHAPLLTSLCSGDIVYRTGADSLERIRISSGFARVCSNSVTVCVEM